MKKYLITSKEFYSNENIKFKTILDKKIKQYLPQYILFRDKESSNYTDLARDFITVCKKYETLKSFLHQDIDLAKELGACGVHLTSKQFDKIECAKSIGLEVIVSTHTHQEVLEAQKAGADAVTYSPIFYSPNKGEPKGLDDLKKLLDKCNIKVFALGGIISKKHISELEKTGVYGFASIRYFY